MTNRSWIERTLVALAILLAPAIATAQTYPVTFGMQSVMATFLGETGVVSFRQYDAAFVPAAGELRAEVVLADAEGTVLARHPFFDSYHSTSQVFARILVVGPAEVQLSEPGLYNIFFLVDGEVVTRMPFVVTLANDGGDPFEPEKTYSYDGFWRQLGFLTEPRRSGFQGPIFHFWVGSLDLADPATQDTYVGALYDSEGTSLYHTKRGSGHIATGHFARTELQLYHRHEKRDEANAPLFTMADLAALDGDYVLRVFRGSDNAVIRTFALTFEDGALIQHPRAVLGYEPQMDAILPRVLLHGTDYVFVEATWFENR